MPEDKHQKLCGETWKLSEKIRKPAVAASQCQGKMARETRL